MSRAIRKRLTSGAIPKRLTQSQRRELTRTQLLKGAEELFGEYGYTVCSLEQIAGHCGMTIGAIYHHFGSKKTLFAAVNETAELRVVAAMRAVNSDEPLEFWRAFLRQCADPGFRRIVLIDAPTVLGRERWVGSPITLFAARKMQDIDRHDGGAGHVTPLYGRMLRGAMSEAALAIAESDGDPQVLQQADSFITAMLEVLLPR